MTSFHPTRDKIEVLVLSKNDPRIPDSQRFDFLSTRSGLHRFNLALPFEPFRTFRALK